MPTVPRRPAAQRERDRLEARRLRAAELFAVSVRQAEVARELSVSAQAVGAWHARFQQGGTEALRSQGPTRAPSISANGGPPTLTAARSGGRSAS
jgi:hypothetical protein